MSAAGRPVLVMAPLPPPAYGQSLINAAVVRRLAEDGVAIAVHDLSPGRLQRGWRYHVRKMARVARGGLALLRHAAPGGATLYTACGGGGGLVYTLGLAALAGLLGYRVVVHHHTGGYFLRRHAVLAALLRLARPGDVHVVLGPAMAAALHRLYRTRAGVVVASNAVHIVAPAVPRPGTAGGPLRLGVIGMMTLDKGLADCVAVVEQAGRDGLDVRLELAGPVYDPAARAVLDSLVRRFPGRVAEWGEVSGPAKDAFFADIDVLLFPSRLAEGQPLVILEAMSRGVPVIARETGFVGELCGPGVVGIAASRDFAAEACRVLAGGLGDGGAQGRRRFEALRQDSAAQLAALIALLRRERR